MKKKNTILFKSFQKDESLDCAMIQNYNPLYKNFFRMNNKNYNSFQFHHLYSLKKIEKKINDNVYFSTIVNQISKIKFKKKVFLKMVPLINVCQYLCSKKNHIQKWKLPTLDTKINTKNNLLNIHNSAYIDSFFIYLTSQLLNKYGFIHGLQYYGSYMGIKKNFTMDVFEDLDVLMSYETFHENKNKLFTIDSFDSSLFQQPKIHISEKSLKTTFSLNSEVKEYLSLPLPLSSTSSTSTRTSLSFLSSSINERSDENEKDKLNLEYQEVLVQIPEFPVQMIFMENCHSTIDDLILTNDLCEGEWLSIFFQIIMILITYQKVFDFTHNDLHVDNIMYQYTKKQYIVYKYDKNKYKIPTYGRIIKIIDFGRSIYHFKGKRYCSDHFFKGNDAYTQYNTEPFFENSKKRIDPNPSFDLCRFSCSIFDYLIESMDEIKTVSKIKNKIKRIVAKWCLDDKNKNIVYNQFKKERYLDFKLYIMIARNVHNHIPKNELLRKEFSIFHIQTNDPIDVNIDAIPCMI
jgi:hypothetical protein